MSEDRAPGEAAVRPGAAELPGSGRPVAGLRAALRMLGFAWAADRRLAIWTLVLLTLQAVAASLFSLWLRLFTDGAAAHHQSAVLLAGLAMAACIAIVAAVEYAGNRTRMTLGDKTQHLLDWRLLELVGRSPTLAIHQTPEYLRELELLQSQSWEFSSIVPSLIEAMTTAVRIVITIALLASVTPLLLVLPVFGLPTLLLARQSAGLFNTGNELAAEPSRRAEMLYQLAASRTPCFHAKYAPNMPSSLGPVMWITSG